MDEQLTERELVIAKHAARLAVEEMQNEFYKFVGKGIINRALTILGLLAVVAVTWLYSSGRLK